MRLFLKLIVLLFLPTSALTANYALVIGGSSEMAESKRHEFARNTAAAAIGLREKGYQVAVLFGSGSEGAENKKYPADHQKISSLQKENITGFPKAATPADLEKALESLIKKVNPGDKVEIQSNYPPLAKIPSHRCGGLHQQHPIQMHHKEDLK